MIRTGLSTLLLVCLLASGASGGAWLREQGKSFLSFSGTVRIDPDALRGLAPLTLDQEISVYFERGFRPKLTLGADLNWTSENGGKLLIFGRRPLGDPSRTWRKAYELGVGVSNTSGQTSPLLKGGLSLGRGFESRWGNGWIALDGAIEFDVRSGEALTKIDSTIGLTLRPRLKAMMQVFVAQKKGADTIVTLTPTLVWQTKNANRSLIFGVEARKADDLTIGLKLGFWQNF